MSSNLTVPTSDYKGLQRMKAVSPFLLVVGEASYMLKYFLNSCDHFVTTSFQSNPLTSPYASGIHITRDLSLTVVEILIGLCSLLFYYIPLVVQYSMLFTISERNKKMYKIKIFGIDIEINV